MGAPLSQPGRPGRAGRDRGAPAVRAGRLRAGTAQVERFRELNTATGHEVRADRHDQDPCLHRRAVIGAGRRCRAAAGLAASPTPSASQRSATHHRRRPSRIFPLINDLHQFNAWNPYDKKDPAMQRRLPRPGRRPRRRLSTSRATRTWARAASQIVDARAAPVTMKLDMLEPFEGHNIVEFTPGARGRRHRRHLGDARAQPLHRQARWACSSTWTA